MRTPEQIHEWVARYNWDDGFRRIWPIVNDKETEFATALLIYWRIQGPWFKTSPFEEYDRLHDTVKERLLSNFYTNRRLQYYPIEDYKLFKTQVYKLRKSGLPNELIEPNYFAGGEQK